MKRCDSWWTRNCRLRWHESLPVLATTPNTSTLSCRPTRADTLIWAYAAQTACVIVTKDEDFAKRAALTPSGPAVVWLRIGNVDNRALRAALLPLWPAVVDAVGRGKRIVEVRAR